MLEPNSLSLAIQNGFSGKTIKDSYEALNTFWGSIKTYFQQNAIILYSWAGVNPTSGAPDPLITVNGILNTSMDSGLRPSGLTEPASAILDLQNQINTAVSNWQIIFPPELGFILSPMNVIPMITLVPSGFNEPKAAQLDLATKLIMGIKTATPGVGSHLLFNGTATCISIS